MAAGPFGNRGVGAEGPTRAKRVIGRCVAVVVTVTHGEMAIEDVVARVIVVHRWCGRDEHGMVPCIAGCDGDFDRINGSRGEPVHLNGGVDEFKKGIFVMKKGHGHVHHAAVGRSNVFHRDG